MKVSDNVIVATTSDNPSSDSRTIDTEHGNAVSMPPKSPTTETKNGIVGADTPIARRKGAFEPGNQLWKRRQAADAKKNRQALRDALYKALTPDKMAKAVRKMLVIINGKDAKAAVAAFKVLTEAAGIKAEPDSGKGGPSFVFILPGPGAIPEGAVNVREGQLRQTLPAPEVVDTTAEPQDV